jgi:long-chain acyl-CoA synthetase
MLSTDLGKLIEELNLARPHYFQNVPALLERVRSRITSQLQERGGIALALFEKGETAWKLSQEGKSGGLDRLWISLARRLVFARIKEKIGPNLEALICGSAPLSTETQLFFHMLGIKVLQVYGLTETTGLCTMDEVNRVRVGFAGPAIADTEMMLGENDEILVRGPHVFPGYWNRPQTTAEVMLKGWFHTGDQGTRDETGNWKITGRIKNLIIPTSGHNISPEPIEQLLSAAMPEAEHVVVIGNGRKFLAALISGNIPDEKIQGALEQVNRELPHYKQVHRYYRCPEPFSPANGLLTALGKFKRTAIEAHFKEQIDQLYE